MSFGKRKEIHTEKIPGETGSIPGIVLEEEAIEQKEVSRKNGEVFGKTLERIG